MRERDADCSPLRRARLPRYFPATVSFLTLKQHCLLVRWWMILLVGLARLQGEAPPLEGFYPAGGQRGTTNIVTALGKFGAWPLKVWSSGAGLTFGAQTNKGRFTVAISPEAASGPRLVRLYNDDGASEPRIFVVGEEHEITETEPNNHFAKPQRPGQLPVVVNGRLDKSGDVDSFAIDLDAGQWLDARVDCYTLMSKADAVLRLVTTNGQQLAWNHDFITLDPRLISQAPAKQTVVLQIFGFDYPPGSDIRLTGGDAVVYRLHMADSKNSPLSCGSSTEREPNDVTEAAPELKLPAVVLGAIGTAGDEDRFRFAATKDEFIEARVEADSFGSPLDAWLKIEDAAGNSLVRNDDAEGSRDPRLEWKVSTNGSFVVALGSVTHRGGKDFCYRLTVQNAVPDYRATLASGSLTLTRGSTNELKLELKRLRGFTNELAPRFRDLPPGVTSLTTNLPPKDGTLSIQLCAATNAAAFQGAVQLSLVDRKTQSVRPVAAELTTRGETGFNHLLVETLDEFWLTVREKPMPDSKPAPRK